MTTHPFRLRSDLLSHSRRQLLCRVFRTPRSHVGILTLMALMTLATSCGGGDSPSSPGGITPTPQPTTTAVTLTLADGDRQQAPTGVEVTTAPTVIVRDASSGQPLAGVALKFTITSGGGSVGASTASTDASGRATCQSWKLGAVGDQQLRVESADAKYVASAPVLVQASAVAAGGASVGPPRSTTLASSAPLSVIDTVTGLRFNFPQGAQGRLDVARVQPLLNEPATGLTRFAATFTGTQQMEVAVALDGGELAAYFYGEMSGVATSGPGGARWWAVPIARVRNDTAFAVLQSSRTTGISAPRAGLSNASTLPTVTASPTVQAYAVVPLPPTSPSASVRRQYRTAVEQVIDWWKTNLGPSASARLSTNIAADPWNFSTGSSGESYYAKGFWTSGIPWLYYNTGKELTISARHEGSHYVTHMLLGETRYREIEEFVPPAGHDLGVIAGGFRKSMIEEYAHIANFLMAGSLDGHDLRSLSASNNFRQLMGNSSPRVVDYPSLEGFGAAMLAGLTRIGADTMIYDFFAAGSRTRTPALGVTTRQLLDAMATGPRTPNELRALLVPLAGSDATLAAVLEPLGWSYNGLGRVVDERGIPVPNAVIASVVTANGKSYRTVGSTPSGADGKFWLPRIYPGTSTLRVYTPKTGGGLDSIDAKVLDVAWEKATTDSVTIGDITVATLTSYKGLFIKVDGMISPNTLGGDACRPNFYVNTILTNTPTTTREFALSWNGLNFSASGETTYDVPKEYSGSLLGRYTNSVAVQGTLVPGRGDTLWMTVQGSSDSRQTDYVFDVQTQTGRWIESLRIPTSFTLRNVPITPRTSTAPLWMGGTITGPAAVAAIGSNWSFEYYSVSNLIPTFHPQSCLAYALGPNLSVQVQLLQR